MGYGILIGVLIGIILSLLYDKILSPIIDYKFEKYKYKVSTICTEEKLKADEAVVLFTRKYPEYAQEQEEPETSGNLIGFRMDNPVDEECYDDEEYEDECDE